MSEVSEPNRPMRFPNENEEGGRAYKDLAKVEQTFRCMKTVDLQQPAFDLLESSVPG